MSCRGAWLIVIALGWCFPPVLRAQDLQHRQLITSQTLRQAGVARVSDILRFVDAWTLNTTDGYTWRASPNGLSTYQQQDWIVLLDGQRVDIDLFDVHVLNMLPISVDQIDSVVVLSTPQIHSGFFADRGLIHLYSRRVERGKTLHAVMAGGNETGDPGPYRYTDYSTPNVDAIGPDGSINFGIGNKNLGLRLNATIQQQYFTDVSLRKRTLHITGMRSPTSVQPSRGNSAARAFQSAFSDFGLDDKWPGMRRVTSSVGLTYTSRRFTHRPFAGYTKARKYFYFSEFVGREIPVDNRYFHVGSVGTLHLTPGTDLNYRLTHSSNQLSEYRNIMDFDFDWTIRRELANAELAGTWPALKTILGAGAERVVVSTRQPIKDDTEDFGRFYAELSLTPSISALYRVGAMITLTDRNTSAKAFWNNSWRLSRGQELMTAVSFSQRNFEENLDIWFWTARGYGVLGDNGITHTFLGEINRSNVATADITWHVRLAAGLSVAATGWHRHFSDMYLESRAFNLNPSDCAAASPTEIHRGVSGRLSGFDIRIVIDSIRPLVHRAYFRHRATVSGDRVFEDSWLTVPERSLVYQVSYTPRPDLDLWAMLTHTSSSYWRSYQQIEGIVCDDGGIKTTYSPDVAASSVLDISLRKSLWQKRLSAGLLGRNVWNGKQRYHPIGASFDLSVHVLFTLLLHSS